MHRMFYFISFALMLCGWANAQRQPSPQASNELNAETVAAFFGPGLKSVEIATRSGGYGNIVYKKRKKKYTGMFSTTFIYTYTPHQDSGLNDIVYRASSLKIINSTRILPDGKTRSITTDAAEKRPYWNWLHDIRYYFSSSELKRSLENSVRYPGAEEYDSVDYYFTPKHLEAFVISKGYKVYGIDSGFFNPRTTTRLCAYLVSSEAFKQFLKNLSATNTFADTDESIKWTVVNNHSDTLQISGTPFHSWLLPWKINLGRKSVLSYDPALSKLLWDILPDGFPLREKLGPFETIKGLVHSDF